nr:BON1-associated protein 2 [Ipomoea batatas]
MLLCGSTPLPNCNYKFLFRISPDFISSETSRITFEFYVVACIKDILVGSVCFLLSSCPTTVKAFVGTPAFIAAQIQCRSERFNNVLSIRATLEIVLRTTAFGDDVVNLSLWCKFLH